MRSLDVELGAAWTGTASVRLFDAPADELARLEPVDPIAGYWRQVGRRSRAGHGSTEGGRGCGSLWPMRLVRFRHGDRIATGAVASGEDVVRILRAVLRDPLPRARRCRSTTSGSSPRPAVEAGCAARYAAHAAEFGMTVPRIAALPEALDRGDWPHDPIELWPISRRVDYEGELAVVIGALARNVRTGTRTAWSSVTPAPTTSRCATCRGPTTSGTRAGVRRLASDRYLDRDRSRPERDPGVDAPERRHRRSRDAGHGLRAATLSRHHSFTTLLPGDVILIGTLEGVAA